MKGARRSSGGNIAMHNTDRIEAVMRYHERTKHQFNRYADGPGQLDWANQPNPFRRYEGAPICPPAAAHCARSAALTVLRRPLRSRFGAERATHDPRAVPATAIRAGHIGLEASRRHALGALYHFTVGGAVDDPRLTTLTPYGIDADVQGHGIDLR